MDADQAIQLVRAVAQLIGVLVWPAALVFILVRFRSEFAGFLSNLAEFNLKMPGVEATAKRQQVEAAAALGAAAAARGFAGGKGPAADPRDVAEALPGPRAQRRIQGARVLWVADRPDSIRFERMALEALGVTIDLSASAEEALAKVGRQAFDLIISDTSALPGEQDSYALVDQLRKVSDHTPLVIYGSSQEAEHAEEARKHGAIGSTNEPQELVAIVTRALTSR